MSALRIGNAPHQGTYIAESIVQSMRTPAKVQARDPQARSCKLQSCQWACQFLCLACADLIRARVTRFAGLARPVSYLGWNMAFLPGGS